MLKKSVTGTAGISPKNQEKLTMGDRSDLKYAQKIHPETETFILL
jgi:hypothetical protein